MEYNLPKLFGASKDGNAYALIILDVPINEPAYDAVSTDASMILCADGAANRLYDLSQKRNDPDILPTAVIGDLDSIFPNVRSHYASLHPPVPIHEDPDQYSTDFTKCLKYLRSSHLALPNNSHSNSSDPPISVLALGGLSGRVDQGLSQLHHLFLAPSDPSLLHPNAQIFLLSDQSLTFPLHVGKNTIIVASSSPENYNNDDEEDLLGEHVGIIPLDGPTTITTEGLEWDVQDWPTRMGGQVSTSNRLRKGSGGGKEGRVMVQTDRQVLFTIELAERLKGKG
ncbi:MAG: hypothetical protein Q9227_001480 [Pyrenula ochraceoflavens]